jgi:hypothetical protein
MNPVKPYNVIISNEPKTIEEIIAVAQGGSDVLKDDLLLFTTMNDNILSFEHQYNFNEKNNKGSLIKIDVIDPDQLFLSRFVGNSIKSLIGNKLANSLQVDKFKESVRKKEVAEALKGVTLPVQNAANLSIIQRDVQILAIQQEVTARLNNTQVTELEKEKAITFFSDKYKNNDLAPSSIDSLITDLGLSGVPEVPYPYLFFYYGGGANKDDWAGPIMAQFTEANYNYSYESGQKSISLEFTSTHEFLGFSKLGLENMGKNLRIDPNYRLAFYTDRPQSVNPRFLSNVQGQAGKGVEKIHDTIINVLEDYIKKVTTQKANVLILLPDFNLFFDKVKNDYFKVVKPTQWNTPYFPTYNQYLGFYKLFADMGFEVFSAIPKDLTKFTDDDLGKPVNNSKFYDAQSYFFGPGGEELVEEYEKASRGGLFNAGSARTIVAIGLRKKDDESIHAPLQKVMSNISNVVTNVTPQILVVDDYEFLTKFKTHCDRFGYKNIVKDPSYPLIIFGDLELIQLYFAGRIIYEDRKLYTKVVATTTTGNQQATNTQKANLAIQLKKRNILSSRDNIIFNNPYIINIAVPTFLQLSSKNINFTLPSDVFTLNTNDIRGSLNRLGVPILKLGYAESNILDIDVNIKDYFNSILTKIRFPKEQAELVFTGISPDNLNLLNLVSKDGQSKLVSVLENKSLTLGNLVDELQSVLVRDEKLQKLNKSPQEKIKTLNEIITFLIKENLDNTPAFNVILKLLGKQDPHLMYYDLLNEMVKNTYQGVIKTTPFFKLSKAPTLLPPALLLIRESNFVPYDKTNGIVDSIKGFYNIMGYKHIISKTEVSTELFVVRHINVGGLP